MAKQLTRKKGKSGNAKHGRYKLKCAAYSRNRRFEKNKRRKLQRHLKKHGNDKQALHAFTNIII